MEVKDAEKHPLNAGLLTMLLLTVSFGATVGWRQHKGSWEAGVDGAKLCRDEP